MDRTTVSKIIEAGLCTGCGVCAGVCPKTCIGWELLNGIYQPVIDRSACIGCGLCMSVCPGFCHHYEPVGDALTTVTGPYLASFNAWSRDVKVRHVSASGGVVTTMVRTLLELGRYDSVFCLDGYDYRHQLRTHRHTAEDILPDTPKSRYLPVSHEEAVRYLLSHREERIIFIATSCALRGLVAVIEQKKLNREKFLLIGLFCDKVFNFNVLSYWQDRYCGGSPIREMYFKNKESGGWPGNMKFIPESGESFYRPLAERGAVKPYFMPERCLYCVDKLNVMADISLGDNYTEVATSDLGSNSVILRTARGMEAWNSSRKCIEAVPVDMQLIQKAQYLQERLNNLYFGTLKTVEQNLNVGVPMEHDANEYAQAWKTELQRLRSGSCYDLDPSVLKKQMKRDHKKNNPFISFLRRGFCFIKRRIV